MKVLCINSKGFINPVPPIQEGKEYIVIKFQENPNGDGKDYYRLKGIKYSWYWTARFVPVSDIDETEFERNYLKQLV